jgi:hypothetical protein
MEKFPHFFLYSVYGKSKDVESLRISKKCFPLIGFISKGTTVSELKGIVSVHTGNTILSRPKIPVERFY